MGRTDVSERFYCPDPPRAGRFDLGPDESRHLSRVCRLGPGDRVEIFDGRGFATAAEVVVSSSDRTELIALGEPIAAPSPLCSLTLATAIPKGDRFDWLVEKATELGVDRLFPIVAERSVVHPRTSKLVRLRRTIVEASKQCRRARLMQIDEPGTLGDLVDRFTDSANFLADPVGAPPASWPILEPGRAIVLAVGPEGGFSDPEKAFLTRSGWIPIRLGHNTLRIETAGLAVAAALIARVPETQE